MELKIIYIFLFIIFFNIILSKDIEFDILTFDEAVDYINYISYTQEDYDNIIDTIKHLFIEYYVYLDISKNPPSPYQSIDIIKELSSINTRNITFYDFYLQLFSIFPQLQDEHLQLFFKRIRELEYIGPVFYYIKTINNKNYLYLKLIKIANEFYNEDLLNEINKNIDIPIKNINGKEPFDYITTFGRFQKVKSEHAQFINNLKDDVILGHFNLYPFIKEDLTNITITFENNKSINFDYKIVKLKEMSRELSEFYKKKMKEYKYSIKKPTFIEISKIFNEEKNNIRNLKESIWDYEYEKKLKVKIDNENKVNVIYQKSFFFYEIIEETEEIDENAIEFHKLITRKINNNNYPIILIEDYNAGGFLDFAFIMLNVLNSKLSVNTINLAQRPNNYTLQNETEIDDYGNGIKHNRTKIERLDFTNYYQKFENIKIKERKPTEIIVFTDGYAYSGTSVLIKNLQETGNAIIVGFNGIPSEEKKNEKFDSCQAPSVILDSIDNDYIMNNLNEYGIELFEITYQESFNDSYINKNETPIPRDFIINPIDERSNIYGIYDDDKYIEFVNEAKRIFEKYKTECNSDNKNMVLLSDKCKFDDKNKIGGFKCINGKWSNECQVSNCIKPYIFNTYTKTCEKSFIYINQTNNEKNKENLNDKVNQKKEISIIKIILIIIFIVVAIFLYIIYKNRKNNNSEIESVLIQMTNIN